MSNNRKIYFINKRDELIYDAKEVQEYIKEKLKNLVLKNYGLFFHIYFNNYFIPMTAEIEKEILSKEIDKNQKI